MKTALASNRDLGAARFAIRQAEARLQQSGLLSNPEFELSRAGDRLTGNEGEYDFSTGFKQRFPITGRLAKEKAVARVDVALALAEVRNQERLVAGEVLGLGRDWLVIRDKLQANDETMGIIQKLIESSEKRLKVAEVSAADVNLTRIEAEKITLTQATLRIEQETAAIQLNGLLGRPPQTKVELTGSIQTEMNAAVVAEASSRAVQQRPDRQLAALAIDRAAAEVVLAHAQKWEDWTVGFGYSRTVGKFDSPIGTKRDNLLGASISIPLPFWNKNQGKITEAQVTRERTEAELSALELKIRTETRSAENQMRRQSGILRQYREVSLKLGQENLALLQKGYGEGLYPITAVIQAQQQLIELRQSYLEAVAEFTRAKTAWETATGAVLFTK